MWQRRGTGGATKVIGTYVVYPTLQRIRGRIELRSFVAKLAVVSIVL